MDMNFYTFDLTTLAFYCYELQFAINKRYHHSTLIASTNTKWQPMQSSHHYHNRPHKRCIQSRKKLYSLEAYPIDAPMRHSRPRSLCSLSSPQLSNVQPVCQQFENNTYSFHMSNSVPAQCIRTLTTHTHHTKRIKKKLNEKKRRTLRELRVNARVCLCPAKQMHSGIIRKSHRI